MIRKFLQLEATSGMILAACTLIALTIANGPLSKSYFYLLHASVLGLSVHHWINDGLMTIFFFVVGMEIKRELREGELSSIPKAALPIIAAIGGMIAPALIYYFFNPHGPTAHGWGIPMATDIAFAVGVLSLFGRRVPLALKVFLLALAIVDDLGAVVVIAVFYTQEILFGYLLAAAVAFAGILALNRFAGVRAYWAYTVIGAIAWFCFLRSGVHATISGVILGLLCPLKLSDDSSPLHWLVKVLHPYVNFLIMPLFALANAGVDLRGANLTEIAEHHVSLGIALGLVAGKPLGIFTLSKLGVLSGVAELPPGLSWMQVLGVGILGGIGFTMALFIAGLALPPDFEIYGKAGILGGSLVAGAVGISVFTIALARR